MSDASITENPLVTGLSLKATTFCFLAATTAMTLLMVVAGNVG